MNQKEAKKATLAELAELTGGRVVGDGSLTVSRVAPIHVAEDGDIAFVSNPKYISALETTAATAVIIHPDLGYDGEKPYIESKNPYLAFAKILTHLSSDKPECKGLSESAFISASARIGDDVTVSPGCFVGEHVTIGAGSYLYPGVALYDHVVVGENALLHAGAVVREGCQIGHRVILQPNVVIGSDGFGFAPDGDTYFKIPQVGIVVIEDDVEIGACSTVDRAAMGQTRVRKGSKIDNLVQIGHNVEIGENTLLVAQTGIAGSTVIGNHCTFGGQSGTVGHIKVGDNVTVVARGSVTKNVEGSQILAGFPMMPHKEWLKANSSVSKLPNMRKELSRLNKKIKELENRMKES